MILQSAQRLLSLIILGFAVMGFVAVPLGDKTGYEHVAAFLESDEAQVAGQEVTRSLSEAKLKLENELAQRTAESGSSPNESEQR